MNNEISCETMKKLDAYCEKDVVRRALTSVFSKTNMNDMAFSTSKAKVNQFIFSIDNKTMGATSQNASGRCWLFAATNVLREIVAKKLNLESFELSQSYLAFWDKFERINYSIDSVIATANEAASSRVVDYIVATGVHDGGQWDMFVNLVTKYGVVPKVAYPETFQSSNTGNVNRHINNYLRAKTPRAEMRLRRLPAEDSSPRSEIEMLEKTYSFLAPATTFPRRNSTLNTRTRTARYSLKEVSHRRHSQKNTSAHSSTTMFPRINAPTEDKPFDKTYTVKFLGNIVGGKKVCYLNLTIEEMKELVVKQLKDGELVRFGSDCGKYGDGAKAAWDPEQYDDAALTGLDSAITKEDMLNYHVSQMNHADGNHRRKPRPRHRQAHKMEDRKQCGRKRS